MNDSAIKYKREEVSLLLFSFFVFPLYMLASSFIIELNNNKGLNIKSDIKVVEINK